MIEFCLIVASYQFFKKSLHFHKSLHIFREKDPLQLKCFQF